MTTLRTIFVRCPKCETTFAGKVAASYGYGGIDEFLCKEFWGYNPMPTFLKRCPKCEFVDFTSEFGPPGVQEDGPLIETQSCDNYELYADRLEQEGERLERVGMIYHMGACCKKLEGEDPGPFFAKALEMFKRAKENGVDMVGKVEIDVLIEKLSK